jgi:ATP-dependent exoDNAse (exonuclease V) alpha subunit
MALYHLTTKPVSRAAGRSAPESAAYRSGEKIQDHSTGETWDYTRKQGVEHSEIILPTAAAKRDIQWARDRERLWNAAELCEKRKDARVAREWEFALPHEFGRAQRVGLAREFAVELADRYGCAVDVALHRPHRLGDQRNFHAHLFATTRTVEATGLGRKTDIELGDRDRFNQGLGSGRAEIKDMRARWEVLMNQRLQELGIAARVDHRSLKDQGIEREPTVHLGPSVIGMERRGIRTEVGERVREEQRREMELRLEKAKELGQLARESQDIEKSILDLSGDLKAALKERDQQQALEAEARIEGKDALRAFREALAQERGILKEISLERVKDLERGKALELEKERTHERNKGLARDGPDFER